MKDFVIPLVLGGSGVLGIAWVILDTERMMKRLYKTGVNPGDSIITPGRRLPWSFRIRQACSILFLGEDLRYDAAIECLKEVSIECARYRQELEIIATDSIGLQSDYVVQLTRIRKHAQRVISGVSDEHDRS